MPPANFESSSTFFRTVFNPNHAFIFSSSYLKLVTGTYQRNDMMPLRTKLLPQSLDVCIHCPGISPEIISPNTV